MKVIVNGKIIQRDRILENMVLLYNGKITAIQSSLEDIQVVEFIDARGCYVSPGFIDIHIHGCFGYDVMDGDAAALRTISTGLCQNGVTGFLPATMSVEKEILSKALGNISNAVKAGTGGAKILGVHLEGPFINPIRKGAHALKSIISADYELIKDYLEVIKLITIAPEMEGNMDFIKGMNRHGHISFSIGHSNATYEEALAAIEAGIKSATHLFNAMSGLNHREPGVVGAVLNSDIYCELIADKIHVHPAMFKLLANVKGSDRIILITDAMRAACMKQGIYDLGGQQVIVEKGSARLEDGTLAGSVLRLNEAIRNIVESKVMSLPEAIATVTINPARLIGLDCEIGSIEAGKNADIVIFDKDIDIKATIINGEICYTSKGWSTNRHDQPEVQNANYSSKKL